MTSRSVLLDLAARPLYLAMLTAALWFLLRGHNEPGGGFIGGLIAVAASSLLAISLDPNTARRWQPLPPMPLAMLGVGLALASGLIAACDGLPYLTHLWVGRLSTALIFDVGVFFAVWGALTGYVYALLDAGAAGGTGSQT